MNAFSALSSAYSQPARNYRLPIICGGGGKSLLSAPPSPRNDGLGKPDSITAGNYRDLLIYLTLSLFCSD